MFPTYYILVQRYFLHSFQIGTSTLISLPASTLDELLHNIEASKFGKSADQDTVFKLEQRAFSQAYFIHKQSLLASTYSHSTSTISFVIGPSSRGFISKD